MKQRTPSPIITSMSSRKSVRIRSPWNKSGKRITLLMSSNLRNMITSRAIQGRIRRRMGRWSPRDHQSTSCKYCNLIKYCETSRRIATWIRRVWCWIIAWPMRTRAMSIIHCPRIHLSQVIISLQRLAWLVRRVNCPFRISNLDHCQSWPKYKMMDRMIYWRFRMTIQGRCRFQAGTSQIWIVHQLEAFLKTQKTCWARSPFFTELNWRASKNRCTRQGRPRGTKSWTRSSKLEMRRNWGSRRVRASSRIRWSAMITQMIW